MKSRVTILQQHLQPLRRSWKIVRYLFIFLSFACSKAFAQSSQPEKSPESHITIPLTVNLKPFYALAEGKVAKVFSSPNYPHGWVQSDCATRYKYVFRRSPFRMNMNGNQLQLAFTGYYKLIGSTRICVNGTVVSPWTPPCRCGFDEGERKVVIGFSSSFKLLPNYQLITTINRMEPKALDQCEVCFWGHNVTTSVLDGIRTELDLTKKSLDDSFGVLNLKGIINTIWVKLNEPYTLPGMGYFNLHPKSMSMENLFAENDLLHINIGITANPAVSSQIQPAHTATLPTMSGGKASPGFNIFLEAALQYDSLSQVLTNTLKNKRFDLGDGLLKKHVVLENIHIAGAKNGDLKIQVDFTGSFNGSMEFNGQPVYHEETESIQIQNLDYNLQTRNLLLKTAKWLFSQKIRNELASYSYIKLRPYFDTAAIALKQQINKQWMKGVASSGHINSVKLISLEAHPDQLLIKSNASGEIRFLISDIDLSMRNR